MADAYGRKTKVYKFQSSCHLMPMDFARYAITEEISWNHMQEVATEFHELDWMGAGPCCWEEIVAAQSKVKKKN